LERAALTGFQIATREAVAGFQELESEVGRALGMLQTIEAVGGNRVRGLAATFETLPGPVREAAAAVQNFATSGQEELAVQRDRALQAAEALQSLNDPAYNEAISNLLGFADVASQALGRIRDEAGATAGALSALGGASGPDAAIAGIRESGTGLGAPLTDVVSTWRSPTRSRSGGGGGSGAREITAEMRAADQAIRQAQEAAVQFGDVQAILNERLASGAINLETYNAALEQARERYSQVGEAQSSSANKTKLSKTAFLMQSRTMEILKTALRQFGGRLLGRQLRQSCSARVRSQGQTLGVVFWAGCLAACSVAPRAVLSLQVSHMSSASVGQSCSFQARPAGSSRQSPAEEAA
jgi:hypothetical protein